MGNDWFYSPEAGEICVDVTGMSDTEIRLAHKEIEAECVLSSGVQIVWLEDPERGLREWWIYKGTERV